jgi:hypothetical protein
MPRHNEKARRPRPGRALSRPQRDHFRHEDPRPATPVEPRVVQPWSWEDSKYLNTLEQINDDPDRELTPSAAKDLQRLRKRWEFTPWDEAELHTLEILEARYGEELSTPKKIKLARLRAHPGCPARGGDNR